jgi:hypothetical protein
VPEWADLLAPSATPAAARWEPPPGKRTLPGAIGERVRFVASAAVWLRLPLIDRRGHDGAVAAIGVNHAPAVDAARDCFCHLEVAGADKRLGDER